MSAVGQGLILDLVSGDTELPFRSVTWGTVLVAMTEDQPYTSDHRLAARWRLSNTVQLYSTLPFYLVHALLRLYLT